MKKIFKTTILYTILTVCLMTANIQYANAAASASVMAAASSINVSPLEVVNSPNKYLNKNINFDAKFVAFTSLGLDYQPALREKEKYIGILIARPDVTDHTIPLSEMKMFLTREAAEKNSELESGDKIKITGKVFSNALGDPWVDITTLKVLTPQIKEKK